MKNPFFALPLVFLAACNCGDTCPPGDSLIFNFQKTSGEKLLLTKAAVADSLTVTAFETGKPAVAPETVVTEIAGGPATVQVLIDLPFEAVVCKVKGLPADTLFLKTELTVGRCCGGNPIIRGVKIGGKALSESEFTSVFTIKK